MSEHASDLAVVGYASDADLRRSARVDHVALIAESGRRGGWHTRARRDVRFPNPGRLGELGYRGVTRPMLQRYRVAP